MAIFLPTTSTMARLANLTGLSPKDPAVVQLIDQLVLRGHLVPFRQD